MKKVLSYVVMCTGGKCTWTNFLVMYIKNVLNIKIDDQIITYVDNTWYKTWESVHTKSTIELK